MQQDTAPTESGQEDRFDTQVNFDCLRQTRERWKEAAKKRGMKFAAWIREACERFATEQLSQQTDANSADLSALVAALAPLAQLAELLPMREAVERAGDAVAGRVDFSRMNPSRAWTDVEKEAFNELAIAAMTAVGTTNSTRVIEELRKSGMFDRYHDDQMGYRVRNCEAYKSLQAERSRRGKRGHRSKRDDGSFSVDGIVIDPEIDD